MLMSFSIMGLVSHLSQGLDESIEAEKQFRARLLLQSASVLAAHPAVERGDPLLRQQVSPVLSYEVFLTNEGVHLAINQRQHVALTKQCLKVPKSIAQRICKPARVLHLFGLGSNQLLDEDVLEVARHR